LKKKRKAYTIYHVLKSFYEIIRRTNLFYQINVIIRSSNIPIPIPIPILCYSMLFNARTRTRTRTNKNVQDCSI